MVGTHTIISNKHNKISDYSFLEYEKWIQVSEIYNNDNAILLHSGYYGYPFRSFEYNDWIVTIEGIVFNYTDEYINDICISAILCIEREGNIKDTLHPFVDTADGDFIIQLYNKITNEYCVFNDYLGLIPFYYYLANDIAIFSRTTKLYCYLSDNIKMDKQGVAEFLSLEYTLGDTTYFEDLFSLNQASVLHYKNGKYSVNSTCNVNFEVSKKPKNRKEAISKLSELLVESCTNRVKKLEQEDYYITNGLSGGFDSRLILAMLSKTDVKHVHNFTMEYIQDESKISRLVYDKLNVPGLFTKESFNNDITKLNQAELMWKCDGKVNHYTTSVCYNDAMFQRENPYSKDKKIAIFNGFGGELFRHPLKKKILTSSLSVKLGLYNGFCNVEFINSLFPSYINNVMSKLSLESSNSSDTQLRYIYNEYYKNLVFRGGGG